MPYSKAEDMASAPQLAAASNVVWIKRPILLHDVISVLRVRKEAKNHIRIVQHHKPVQNQSLVGKVLLVLVDALFPRSCSC